MKSFIRALPAALVLAIASVGLSAVAQTPAPADQPTMTQKAEATGAKAVAATKRTSKKAWHATKRTARKAGHATKTVAVKAGDAVASVGHKAANGMRSAGAAIGEKIPGTAENNAAKAAAANTTAKP